MYRFFHSYYIPFTMRKVAFSLEGVIFPSHAHLNVQETMYGSYQNHVYCNRAEGESENRPRLQPALSAAFHTFFSTYITKKNGCDLTSLTSTKVFQFISSCFH